MAPRYAAHHDSTSAVLTIAVASLTLAACSTMHSSVVVEPAAGGGYSGGSVAAPAHTSIPGGSYQVVKGDTLYSIAFRNKVDFRDLAQWNSVAAPYTIHPGQRLKLSPVMATAVATGHPGGAPPPPGPAQLLPRHLRRIHRPLPRLHRHRCLNP
jgi:lipoprotein NlpD